MVDIGLTQEKLKQNLSILTSTYISKETFTFSINNDHSLSQQSKDILNFKKVHRSIYS